MFKRTYLEREKQKPRCAKSDRCLYGDDCPYDLNPINDYYGCFDAGRLDTTIYNYSAEIRASLKRETLRKRRFGKGRKNGKAK